MGRNCNLELSLLPTNNNGSRAVEQRREQLIMFYDGKVSVCEVTQLQARAIIMLANQEMEEKLKGILGSEPSSPSSTLRKSATHMVMNYTNTGLSMQRSLQLFLQKRKSRVQSTAPYNLYSK